MEITKTFQYVILFVVSFVLFWSVTLFYLSRVLRRTCWSAGSVRSRTVPITRSRQDLPTNLWPHSYSVMSAGTDGSSADSPSTSILNTSCSSSFVYPVHTPEYILLPLPENAFAPFLPSPLPFLPRPLLTHHIYYFRFFVPLSYKSCLLVIVLFLLLHNPPLS